jgi:hypothetical protein
MLRHVFLRQLSADDEQARGQNYSSNLKRDGSFMRAPAARIKGIRDIWSHQDAKPGTEDDFIDVQLREISREVGQQLCALASCNRLTCSLTNKNTWLNATTNPPRTIYASPGALTCAAGL